MRMCRAAAFLVLLMLVQVNSVAAGDLVPFRGHWEGSTVSATPVGPNVVLVVSSGTGNATHLGSFEMTFGFDSVAAIEGVISH